MTPALQIAIDAADPHALCRFWAAAMDYDIEDQHEGILRLVEQGHITLDETIEIDGRRAFPEGAACRHRDGLAAGPRLLFQTVPEGKTVKNRVHLDLHFGAESRDAEVARLVGLGASRLWDGQQGPHSWVTLADPEGNEFCVA